ncbi:phage/plasmid primase, P4 family [Chachezhania sediminis]|uniref:phage/plasmid primase, P4 family n=1 Tax=Chachezhania sediminis TaxID=2599291 RepID=UPI00131C0A46|nr:phage/plasmid primase, P4 family [Chachezhania sediminis]
MTDDPLDWTSGLKVIGGGGIDKVRALMWNAEDVHDDPDTLQESTRCPREAKPKRGTSGKGEPKDVDRAAFSGGVLTEDAVALMFTAEHGQSARYDHDVGRWAIWDDDAQRWQWDKRQTAAHWCRELARSASMGEAPKVLERVRRRSFLSGVEAMCRADPTHAVTHEVWDPDNMLLGCPGVTVDLRTGQHHPPRPEDMLTRISAVAPDPMMEIPIWREFLRIATGEDEDLERFLQVFAGYSLTGSVKEHQMVFFHGNGGNGKSLLLNTLVGIMGEYAQTSSMDTFAASPFERHSTDLAAMRGARVVAVSEVAQGVGWNQQRLTQMTGGDKVRARFMRQDEFEYYPNFKLWVVGNHKPELGNVNDAMRRRMNIVPFTHKPERPDPDLFERLKPEWPGILHWMVLGCLEWQSDGLSRPGVILAETDEYFGEQDTFGQWITECCRVDSRDPHCWDVALELYRSWSAFAEARNAAAGTAKSFAEQLKAKGFVLGRRTVKGKTARIWQGVSVVRLGTEEGW